MCLMMTLVFFWATCSLAGDKTGAVRIENARFRPLQIAVPDIYAITGTSAQKISDVIRNDLELSGVFHVLDPRSYIADPKREVASFKTTKYEDWINIGAEGLVKTQAKAPAGGKSFDIDMQLFQMGLGKSSFGKSYRIESGEERFLSHKMADDIFHFFTGEDGPFLSSIVAVKLVGEQKQIVVMDFDGQNERQMTQAKEGVVIPIISADGTFIMYTTFVNHNSVLMEMQLANGSSKRISWHPGLNIGGVLSPDKKKIALTLSKDGDSEIYLMDRRGGNLRRLTNSIGIDTSPSFSPDGKQIAFVSQRSGNPHIYLMNTDGSDVRRLTFQGKYNQTPRFSPRGDSIVFTGRDENKVFDIFVYDLKANKISRVTENQGSNEDPWFAPNGRLIVFSSTRDGGRNLYLSNADGSFQKRITSGGKYWTPSWGRKR